MRVCTHLIYHAATGKKRFRELISSSPTGDHHELLLRLDYLENPPAPTTRAHKCADWLQRSATLENGGLLIAEREGQCGSTKPTFALVANREFAHGDPVTPYGASLRFRIDVDVTKNTHARGIPDTLYVLDGLSQATILKRGVNGPEEAVAMRLMSSTGVGFMANAPSRNCKLEHNVRIVEVPTWRHVAGVPYPAVLMLVAVRRIRKGEDILCKYVTSRGNPVFYFVCTDPTH